MRKTYGDLDLIKLRKEADIDFAHYTFKPGMCSCCYGPQDLPKRYWKDGIIKEDGFEYILFKNAYNGSGIVRKKDHIKGVQYVMWDLSEDKLNIVCRLLQEQVGDRYLVIKPEDKRRCIEIREV